MRAPEGVNWVNFPGIGSKGLDTFNDASLIDNLALTEAENVTLDGGFLSPIKGSTLLTEKPTGESGDALQLITAKTSDGLEYLVVVYANHFYLWHDDNEEWLRINTTYVPTETTRPYGYVNWNNGRGDDRLYVCNGVDNFARFDICVGTVDGAHATGAATVTLVDGTRFPSGGGTLVLMGASSVSTEAYTSRTGNVFTLTGTLSQDIADGASATLDMIEKADMEIGKIVGKYQQRLVVMNYYGGETTGWYSKQATSAAPDDNEDFTTGSNVADASTFIISDGNGGITGFHDFGAFAVIEKEDSIHRLEIVIDDTLGSKLDKITPILSGESLGPLGQLSTLKILNTLYYPTKSNGFISLYPAGTGSDTNVNYKTLSQFIQPTLDTLTIADSNCRGAATSNKAFWAVAIEGGTQNTKVLIYDALRDTWSIRTSWAVKDFAVKNDVLHYLDSSNGRVFECFTGGYNDNNNPYEVKFSTKRFDFGLMSEPKTGDAIYVQGYMTPATKLYIDVLFNEGGLLDTQTFLISKDTERLMFSAPLTNALGEFILGSIPMGWVETQQIGELSFFRAFLGIKPGNGYFNIQLRFRHNVATFFGITGVSFLPRKENLVPALMFIDPI